jgi:hypothetical protein
MRVAGADANPLARLIAKVKTTPIEPASLNRTLLEVEASFHTASPESFSPVVDVNKWFTKESQVMLGKILSSINQISCTDQRDFFTVCFSQIIRKCSMADQRMSVPVRSKLTVASDYKAYEIFGKTTRQNIMRLGTILSGADLVCVGEDARIKLGLSSGSAIKADLIITSPPYAGAQKYVRSSSLSLGWLNMVPEAKLRNLEKLNIGREHLSLMEQSQNFKELSWQVNFEVAEIRLKSKARSAILAMYMTEMGHAALAIRDSLKVGGHLVLVMGDNRICNRPIATSSFVRNLFLGCGFSTRLEMTDHIRSRGLMTKRNKTASLISHEQVFLMRREE